jgi:hypothetical protein
MLRLCSRRRLAALLLLGSDLLFAQSTLPATSPTTLAATSPTIPAASGPVETPRAIHRALVMYAQGQLHVLAENSSLTQILHDISGQTGIRITGDVEDERVYGTYGPDTPIDILARLLDGVNVNVMLVRSAANHSSELILTPRLLADRSLSAGGTDSPGGTNSPSSYVASMPAGSQPQRLVQTMQPGRDIPGGFSNGPPESGQAPGGSTFPQSRAPAAANPVGASYPPSPNGVGTPQQIYQQLQQMQSQQPVNP